MPQAHALITALKKTLKAQGLTYRHVAERLGLSEASVKRVFASERFTLARLEAVCRLLGMEISDLVKRMEAETDQLTELSEDQERELVSDVRLLLVAFLFVNGWTLEDIVSHYAIPETQVVRYLAKLDRLKLIELLPGNRVKLLVSPRFSWRRNGPIQRFFASHLQEDFLKSRFTHKGESFLFVAGMLSHDSSAHLIQRMERLAQEFNERNEEERHLPIDERLGCSMILAFRPWRAEVFDVLRRRD